MINVLAQLGGPRPQSIEPKVNNGDGGIDSPTEVTADAEKEGPGAVGGGEEGGGAVDGQASRLSPQDSGASLLSQFPPTQEMPRAVTQSPIPLPPRADGERVNPEEDDAMRMSPPASAG